MQKHDVAKGSMCMASPTANSASNALITRIQHYMPPDMADDLRGAEPNSRAMRAAFAHIAAARYTVATYLPRLLVHRLLHTRIEPPWLHWVEGSLLFADLSGSTALAERLSVLGREGTELVTDALNDVFTRMIDVIQAHGGDLITFGGDALLVYFGDERHPRTATRAALALLHALEGYSRTVPGIGTFPMHLHIGIESGPIAFVSAGQPHDRHYSALGATVNGVAAAEAHAGSSEVVVGPRAWELISDFATGEECAPNFWRVSAMRPPRTPHPPLEDALLPAADLLREMPHLLSTLR